VGALGLKKGKMMRSSENIDDVWVGEELDKETAYAWKAMRLPYSLASITFDYLCLPLAMEQL